MAAISYSGSKSAVPTSKRLLEEKRASTKFHIEISKAAGLARMYIDKQTTMSKSDTAQGEITYKLRT